jgi:hypothetical protein
VENTPKVKLAIPSLKGFTYSRIAKDFTIPLEYIKNHVYNQCLSTIPLPRGVTITLILSLFTSMNKTKFHAITSFYYFLTVFNYWGSIGVAKK